jgi:hypothetical protein
MEEKTRQDHSRQEKTRQDKTRQDKIRQDTIRQKRDNLTAATLTHRHNRRHDY